ncbi:hypothetical protein BB427_16350 [Pseudoalteromonas sp. BMB]|uniref:ABC transporter permease n=1 Tax=Pseudoalteromonas sp. BMB TaxID=1874619 RepID=UPI00083D6905|nr:ABC transporter permease [Pseudoalteromonas sp. BMB]ODB35877.1 hypothetical protein BB427_16350 [Pseudoalteromonas sp. BMB]
MNQFIYQQKQAWENLKSNKGFISAVVMTMGVTLGALICILSLAYLMILKPLPYPDQERLYRIDQDMLNATGQKDITAYTYPTLLHLFKEQTEFSDSALIYHGSSVNTASEEQLTTNIAFVTHRWFHLIGAEYALGRGFEESESVGSHIPVAVLSYDSWLKEFNRNPDILSQSVTFNGVTYKIIGVLSESFYEPQIYEMGRKTAVWLPWEFNPATELKDSWGSIRNTFTFVGKLNDTLTVTQAEQRITQMIDSTWRNNVTDIPFFSGWKIEMKLASFDDIILGDSKVTAFLLLIGIIGLMAIACVNIANLFISRTVHQQKELAIHAALGAAPSHIFGNLFAQSMLLMFFSTIVALFVSAFGFSLFQRYLSDLLPRVGELQIGFGTVLVGVLLMLFFSLIFTWVCSRIINYRKLNLSLNSSGKGTGVQVSEKSRLILIISQVAIATTLIFGNLILFKNAISAINTPLGIDIENKHTVSLIVRGNSWPSLSETAPFMRELIDGLSSFPQIEEINQSPPPLSPFGRRAITVVATNEKLGLEHRNVAPNYFKFMKQPLLEGSSFTEEHVQNWRSAIIVNDVFAKSLAPEGSALGMQISFGDNHTATVIGVVKSMRLPGESEIPKRAYGPQSPGWAQLIIKLKDNQVLERQTLVNLVNENTSLYSLYEYQNLEEVKDKRLFAQITTAITTAVLSALTLFLAGIGLFGILSYVIQMRKFEIGIRMAIGANRADIIKLIVKESFASVAFGVVLSIGILITVYTTFEQQILALELQGAIALFALTLVMIFSLSLFSCYAPLRKYINRPSIHCLRGAD